MNMFLNQTTPVLLLFGQLKKAGISYLYFIIFRRQTLVNYDLNIDHD